MNIVQKNDLFKTLQGERCLGTTNEANAAPPFAPIEPPEPLDPGVAFLRSVLPDAGPYAVRGIKTIIKKDDPEYKGHRGKTTAVVCDIYVNSLEEIAAEAHRRSACGIDVYFTVASFRQDKGPKAGSNIRELRAFRLDVEGGPDKAKSGEGYDCPQKAKEAVIEFCKDAHLPAPLFVFSGHGVHAYWALTTAIPFSNWRQFASGLKRACEVHGLIADPAITADAARILRVPGTKNFNTP
jgi:hypothetical protein